MKTVLFVLLAITTTMILGDVYAYDPFEVSGTSVEMNSYELDPEVNSIILEIQVNDSQGLLELTFERNFFDSISINGDDEFFILIDGERLSYIETQTTSKSRTIEAKLTSGVYDIEIFGSHLLGKTVEDYRITSQIKEQSIQLLNEKNLLSQQITNLSLELVDVKEKNNVLESKTNELEKKVSESTNWITKTEVQATNLISETEVQATNLISEIEVQGKNINSVIAEQVTAIMAWFKSFF